MPKRVCEDWANLLLNDRTTFQITDAATARYLLGDDEQQVGGLLRDLHFWTNANALVEKAFWSGTGSFVLSVENMTVVNGKAVPSRTSDSSWTTTRPSASSPAGGAGRRDRSGLCLRVSDGRQACCLLTDAYR